MDNICYTVISGPYDKLNTPKTISKGWKYICFTDQNIVSNIWEIRPIPEELNSLSQVKRQRCLKTQPHKYLPEHEWSVYVDANITIRVGMWKLVRDICKKEEFSVTRHYMRDCIYEERKICMKAKKDNGVESEAQIKRYKAEGFPEHFGLNETGLLVRKNCKWVQDLDDMWWNEILNGSHRDQLSFNYCLWKGGFRIHNLNKMTVRKSEYFGFNPHHTMTGNKNRANLLIVHFNTPELTEALYRSICKFTPNSEVYIFDNSNSRPFPYEKFPKIHYMDNTKGQIINFDRWLKNFPERLESTGQVNGWGSAKHTYTIEWCLRNLRVDDFILLDSDILFKKDISSLIDTKYAAVGWVSTTFHKTPRILPMMCYINKKLCLEKNIHYFNKDYIYGLVKTSKIGNDYDTGGNFYREVVEKKLFKKLTNGTVKESEYYVHYMAGSWYNDAVTKHQYKQIPAEEWLKKYKSLIV